MLYWRDILKQSDEIDAIRGGTLDQIHVPNHFRGDTYGELVGYLLNKGIVPLGLYRGVNPMLLVGLQENTQPFVSTNPPPDTKVSRPRVVTIWYGNNSVLGLGERAPTQPNPPPRSPPNPPHLHPPRPESASARAMQRPEARVQLRLVRACPGTAALLRVEPTHPYPHCVRVRVCACVCACVHVRARARPPRSCSTLTAGCW